MNVVVCAAFLRIFGVTLVNPCQSPPKPCHRNDPGDDESISYEMQDTHLSPSILVHSLQAISSSGKTCSRMPLPKCLRSQSSTQLPLHLGDAIAITLAMTRALHSQQASTHFNLDFGHVNTLTVATTIVQ